MPAEGRGFSSEPTSKVGKDRRLGNLATPTNVQRLQTALHAKAKEEPEFRFHALYDKIYRIDVLEYGVAKQKLNLFQFASTTMTQAGASATKVVRCQIDYASSTGTSLHRIPNNIGCHTGFLSRSPFQNPPKYLSLDNSRMPEPSIEKLLAPRRYWYRS